MVLLPSNIGLVDLELAGEIFGLMDGYSKLYPAFQFDAFGQPLPIIGALLAETRKSEYSISAWTLANWLIARTQSLGGARALDFIPREPEAVLHALRTDLIPE